MELDNNMNLMNMVKKNLRNIVSKIISSIIVVTVSGYFLYPLTKQDKSQEIKSQGSNGVNMKDNNGTINYNIYPYVPPVLSVTNKINDLYDLYVTLEMLTNFFKNNHYVYEILKNNLEGELSKFQDFTHTPKVQRSINK